MTAVEQPEDPGELIPVDDPEQPIRFSRLKLFSKSPAHFAAALPEESSALDVGSAAHAMILGVGREVIAYPGKVRRGKEWEAFQSDHPDALILTKAEYGRASRMAKAVNDNADARRVLDGIREQTMFWKLNGRLCRGTPDVRSDQFVTELKTGETSDPRFFPFKMRRFRYDAQLAWYSDGAVLAGHPDPKEHYVVAVEAAYPHVVTVFKVTRWIANGRKSLRLWWERLLQCEAANEWPGYSQSVVDLDPLEEELEMLDAGEVAAARPDWADGEPPFA